MTIRLSSQHSNFLYVLNRKEICIPLSFHDVTETEKSHFGHKNGTKSRNFAF